MGCPGLDKAGGQNGQPPAVQVYEWKLKFLLRKLKNCLEVNRLWLTGCRNGPPVPVLPLIYNSYCAIMPVPVKK